MFNEEFFQYLFQQGYIEPKLWNHWHFEFQKKQEKATEENLQIDVLKPHDETRIIRRSKLPVLSEILTEVEIEKENLLEVVPAQSPPSKEDLDLLQELENLTKIPNQTPSSLLKKEEPHSVHTKVFRIYEEQFQNPIQKPDTQINPMMQTLDISLAGAKEYFKKALEEKEKGILVEEQNKRRQVEYFLTALEYLTLADYLEPDYEDLQSEKINLKNLLFRILEEPT